MNKRFATLLVTIGIGATALSIPTAGSAHSIPSCDRDYHVTIAMDTINPYPVWRDWSVVDTVTGQTVKSDTVTFGTPGTSVSVDLPTSIADHPIEIYASQNYSHVLVSLGAPVVCGRAPTPPPDVVVGPAPQVDTSKPIVKPRPRKPKPKITCAFIRKHYTGQTKLNLLIKHRCYVPPKPNPKKRNTPEVTG